MDKEALKKQLFINIAEALVKQGLLTEAEKNDLKVILSGQKERS